MQAQLEQLQGGLAKRRDDVQKLLGEPKRLQAELEQVPGLVIGRTLEATGATSVRYTKPASACPSATLPTIPFTSGSRLTVFFRTRSRPRRFSTSRV